MAVVAAAAVIVLVAAVVVGGWVDDNLRLCVSVFDWWGFEFLIYEIFNYDF